MSYPKIKIGCVANLYSRQMHFEQVGDTELGHTHQFDHLTLLASGSLEVTIEGQKTVFKAPHMIYIHRNKRHELVALEDNTVAYCIHALRDGNGVGDIIDPDSVPEGVRISEIAKPLAQYL
jgi:mannose-6-phosphate isomerase-like protein (cupin superfamily)